MQDEEGQSKGAGIVEFQHCDEALQAISRLTNTVHLPSPPPPLPPGTTPMHGSSAPHLVFSVQGFIYLKLGEELDVKMGTVSC